MRERRAGDLVGGRYRLERELGAGGMGAVWIAVQEGLGRRVALKTLLPALAQDAKAVARFKREAELAASLGHPHIVQVTDFGSDEGGAFLVMELLQGRSLADAIAAEAPMSAARLAVIGQQVLAALGAAHRAGVVHRDLKPDNVFLTEVASGGELVKLLDFGIARMALGDVGTRLTQTGQLLGTPLYMAPEQARAEEVDARTDLYALGGMLFEGATGRPPFAAPNYAALLTAILTEEPPALGSLRPDLPPDFVAIVETAMAKDPAQRFVSAEAMGRALGSLRPAPRSRADLAFASTMAASSVDAEAATMAAPSSGSEGPSSGSDAPRPGTVALKVEPVQRTGPTGATVDRKDGSPEPDRDSVTRDLPGVPIAAASQTEPTVRMPEPEPSAPDADPKGGWAIVLLVTLLMGLGVGFAYFRKQGGVRSTPLEDGTVEPSAPTTAEPDERRVPEATEPTVEPRVAPVAQPEPEPEPMAEPEPVAEPAPDSDATPMRRNPSNMLVLRWDGWQQADGDGTPEWVRMSEEIEDRVEALRPRFARCGPVPDRVRVRLVIEGDGRVTEVTFPSLADELEPCWARAVRTLSFPRTHYGTRTFTLDFR